MVNELSIRDAAPIRDAPPGMRRHPFRAMGTDVMLIGPLGHDGFDPAAARVEAEFAELEARFSRFRPDSELSRVNASAGRWTALSAPFAELLRFALDGARRSGGLFDPTVLPALVAAGYDRDFEEVRLTAPSLPAPPQGSGGRWDEVDLDGNRLRLPLGAALDFGGVAKGWAVDRAAEATMTLVPWAIVDAGGDVRVIGEPPDGSVEIAIEDPEIAGREVLRLGLSNGALATSSIVFRSWGAGWKAGVHHIIDPRTGRPASARVIQATAWASTCAEAEVRSKWALLTGPAVMAELSVVLFMDDGDVRVNMAFEAPQPRHSSLSLL